MEKSNKRNSGAGMFVGCAVWILVLGVLLSCLLPVATFGGMLSGFLLSDQVAGIVGPILCPEGTTAYIRTFPTTSIDDNGFEQPATGFEMLCRKGDGSSVEPMLDYQFAWIGILTIAVIIVSAVISIFVAGPVGIVVNKILDKMRVRNTLT